MNSINDIWEEVLKVLSRQLTPTAIKTWFEDCTPVSIDGSSFVIHTSSDFKRDIIVKRYGAIIREILSDLFSEDFELTVLTDKELDEYRDEKKAGDTLPELEDYTFDRFVVGPSNKFAHAAALSVAEEPGKRYNPLFIYGNSGLGKTHLLRAIGQAIHDRDPSLKIVYVKGDEFTIEMVRALKDGTMDVFHNKYRSVDLLLVDDIQFIAGKEQTQNEFFHSFNNLYEAGHQIVITSDRPPMEMSLLDDRLRTRFEGGLLADIQPPDLETRMAIVRSKASRLGMILSDEVVEAIAAKNTYNVRQLEGVIKRILARQSISGENISTSTVDWAFSELSKTEDAPPTPELIIQTTALYYGLKPEDLRGQNRSKMPTLARQVSMYLMRTHTDLSLKDIGAQYEDRNHATVLSSIRKVEELMKTDPGMASTIRDISSNIANSHS